MMRSSSIATIPPVRAESNKRALFCGFRGQMQDRKREFESGAFFDFGREIDPAPMLFDHDRMDDCQALAGPSAHTFGGEKGFENSVTDICGNTGACILNLYDGIIGVAARSNRNASEGYAPLFVGVLNCMSGIYDQVKNCLIDFVDHA
jgi:hypothetical protein